MLRIFNPVVTAVVAGSMASALIDLRTRRVPNALTFGIAVVGVVLAGIERRGPGVTMAIAGLLIGLVLMLPGHLIGGTGAGDVKLLAALGTLLGPAGVVVAFFYSMVAGGVLAAIVAAQRGRLRFTMSRTAMLVRTGGANAADIERPTSNNRFAFAPAIALGATLAAMGF